ncbi:MAG: ATP-grasp domain-containing protein [Cocleimonas sp.]
MTEKDLVEEILGKDNNELDPNSMLIWWELTNKVNVAQPKTRIIRLTINEARSGEDFLSEKVNEKIMGKIKKLVDDGSFKYPLFIRTDLSSIKHDFINTCYIEKEENLERNLDNLIMENRCLGFMGVPFLAIVIREYIPLDSRFKAFFGHMPVAPEIRFFYKDGKFECYHNYWPKDSIQDNPTNDPDEWEKKWEEMDTEIHQIADEVMKDADKIAAVLDGYWSIDFAKAKDGRWLFIDSAQGDASYHGPHPLKYTGPLDIKEKKIYTQEEMDNAIRNIKFSEMKFDLSEDIEFKITYEHQEHFVKFMQKVLSVKKYQKLADKLGLVFEFMEEDEEKISGNIQS